MLDREAQLNILANLVEQGCLHQARLISLDELKSFNTLQIEWALQGQVTINDKEVVLCIGVDSSFPLSLPKIFLAPPDALGFIPHLEADGYICYFDSEGLLLNFEDPVGIICEAIAQAVKVLQAGLSGTNRWDFVNEFGAYWQKLSIKTLRSFLPVDNVLRKIFIYNDNQGTELIADDISTIKSYCNTQEGQLDSFNRRSALYVPLQDGTFLVPPRPDCNWSSQEVRQIVWQNLSASNHQLLQQLGRRWKSEELVILGLPRPRGGTVLFGLLYFGVNGAHPLLGGKVKDLIPINVQRHDQEYLLSRGGGQSQICNVRVLVVGCGSVGGCLVPALVQAGIMNLTLVDPDILNPENIYRHILGIKALYEPKVTALKAEIESKYPYLSVTTHQKKIQEAIREGLINLSQFDLVIFATGDHTVELYVNRILHQLAKKPLAVFTWLEPYGIGGHALLTRPNKAGCLQCLFSTTIATDTPLHNQSAFAAYGQTFSKDGLGCGSSYTPYSALDAQKTAQEAARLALDGLTEYEPDSPIRSWKGSAREFVAAGFKVSSRYELTADQLHVHRYDYINSLCPVCGGVRG